MKMRRLFILQFLLVISVMVVAQTDREKVAKERAKALHNAFTELPRSERAAFVEENYSENFLKQYEVKMHTDMLNNLNRDFKESEAVEFKMTDKGINMKVKRTSDGHTVYFVLYIQENSPYKIEGVSIEAGELGG